MDGRGTLIDSVMAVMGERRGQIKELVNAISANKNGRAEAEIVVATDDRTVVASSHSAGRADTQVHVGCISKLFTAALAYQLVLRGKVRLTDRIIDHLPHQYGGHSPLSEVTLEHLISHTHGLDDTDLGPLAPLESRRVDLGLLLTHLSFSPPLAPPGKLYSYGGAGAYMAAAAIEVIHERPYVEVLTREILAPLRIQLRRDDGVNSTSLAEACPSFGGRWTVGVDDLATFIIHHTGLHGFGNCRALAGHQDLMRASCKALPGWAPQEKAINLGWKNYGNDWYGHDAQWLGSSLLVRINPVLRLTIVIGAVRFGGGSPCQFLLSRLLGDVVPSLARIDVPILIDGPRDEKRQDAYVGRYENRSSVATVFAKPDGLHLRVLSSGGASGGRMQRVFQLMPAENHIYVTSPLERAFFSYLQFVGTETDSCEYIWNGQRLWRRVAQ